MGFIPDNIGEAETDLLSRIGSHQDLDGSFKLAALAQAQTFNLTISEN